MYLLSHGYIYFQLYREIAQSQELDLQSSYIDTGEVIVPERKTLGGFIYSEMTIRGLSAREFADDVGVAHTIINKFLNHGISDTYAGKPVGDPSIEFLTKLAKATHTDICSLVALVAPDATTTNAEAQLLAERIARLPALRPKPHHEFNVLCRSQGTAPCYLTKTD